MTVTECQQQITTEIQRLEASRRGTQEGTTHTDHCLYSTVAWWTRWWIPLTPGAFKGGERHLSNASDHSPPFTSAWCVYAGWSARVPDHTTRHRHHHLAWAKSIYVGRGTSGPQCCSLINIDSHWAEIMVTMVETSSRALCIGHCCHQTTPLGSVCWSLGHPDWTACGVSTPQEPMGGWVGA